MNENDVPKNSSIKNLMNILGEILFAQLWGLSDHLTYSLKEQQYQVYKYMPFG